MKKLLVILALIVPVAALAAAPVPYLPVPRGAAVILNTGSTNALGYRIVLQRSGAAEYVHGDKRATANVPEAITTKFFTDMQALPLRSYPMIHCMKSVSFGTSLYVWWKGARSQDLTCGTTILAGDSYAVAQALGLSTAVGAPMHPVPALTNEPRVPAPAPSSNP
ncbi:MAG TPA: hypothetical protein VKT51_00165 [Candidatus Eremiobacteraceae bacterium]|nr:hypothetical protein [Candidatus Eremiobacteraceae bacterium]